MAQPWPHANENDVFQIGIRQTASVRVTDPGPIWQRVESIFTEFCDKSRFRRASAVWLFKPVSLDEIKKHEVIVYLVGTSRNSLIAKHFAAAFSSSPPGPTTLGLTSPKDVKGLSEVYFDNPNFGGDLDMIADCIVHEAMHNKLNMGDEMHQLAGPAGGFLEDTARVLSQQQRLRGMKIAATGTDIRTMAPVLSRERMQILV